MFYTTIEVPKETGRHVIKVECTNSGGMSKANVTASVISDPVDFTVFSTVDTLTIPMVQQGGDGDIYAKLDGNQFNLACNPSQSNCELPMNSIVSLQIIV